MIFISSKSVHPNRWNSCFLWSKVRCQNTQTQLKTLAEWRQLRRSWVEWQWTVTSPTFNPCQFQDPRRLCNTFRTTWMGILPPVGSLLLKKKIKFLESTGLSFTKTAVSLVWMDRFWWNEHYFSFKKISYRIHYESVADVGWKCGCAFFWTPCMFWLLLLRLRMYTW
jgi:hypothetical protein